LEIIDSFYKFYFPYSIQPDQIYFLFIICLFIDNQLLNNCFISVLVIPIALTSAPAHPLSFYRDVATGS